MIETAGAEVVIDGDGGRVLTGTAEFRGSAWVVRCEQYPGVSTMRTRLHRAVEDHRAHLAMFLDVPRSQVGIRVRPLLPDEIRETITRGRRLRETARWANSAAAAAMRAAAKSLVLDGFALRDIGTILGVSYQRAHQLTAEFPHTSEDQMTGRTRVEHDRHDC